MMNIIFIITILFLFVVITFVYYKLKFYRHLNAYYEQYLKKIIYVLSQIRYGNFKIDINDGDTKITSELSKVLNSAVESFVDRENMIQEHIKKEKETSALKTDFIATLTHDLKVPIIAMDKTFDLLLDNKFGDLNEAQREAVSNIKLSNIDLKYLIEALLETYKLEQTKLELKLTYKADIIKLIKETITLVEPIAIAHNKKINFSYKNIDIVLDVDVFLLKRVLQNLILNALSYSVTSDVVDIDLLQSDTKVIINVTDYGVGIDKNEIDKIFDKYYSGATKYIRSSTGLGLYLSNKIVKLHKGKIKVSSKQGEKTTFSVILPLKYENNPQI